MNKSSLFKLLDLLSLILIGGFFIKSGINKKANHVINFILENGISFLKWFASVAGLYAIGYFFNNQLRTTYFLIITLILALSKMGKNLIDLTK